MALEHDSTSPLALAVRKAGSQAAFAKLMGKPTSTVNSWLVRGNDYPAELVLETERLLGISRHDLRPDLYPREDTIPARQPAGQPPAGISPAPAGGSPRPALDGVRP